MIHPDNYEQKIGFDEIRTLIREQCMSQLGRDVVDEMTFSDVASDVNELLLQIHEFRQLMESVSEFPLQYFFDMREALTRIRLTGTHLEEQELFDLRRSLETIMKMVTLLNSGEEGEDPYPALHRLAENVQTYPAMIRRIDSIIDKFGRIKDGATMTLASNRHELQKTEGSI